jgi:hypothetical protein
MANTDHTNIDLTILLDAEDTNGAIFDANFEGENLEAESTDNCNYLFSTEAPGIPDGDDCDPFQMTQADMSRFILYNATRLHDGGIDTEKALRIAYIRYLAVRAGLVSSLFLHATYHVNHDGFSATLNNNNVDVYLHDVRTDPIMAGIPAALTDAWRKNARSYFANYVCILAYVFRIRGHHYVDGQDYDELYDKMKARCLMQSHDLGLTHIELYRFALHSIYPIVLERFWAQMVDAGTIAGTLIKRYRCAGAGQAAIYAAKRGIDDIVLLFPKVKVFLPDQCHRIDELYDDVSHAQNRYRYCINSRYYGVDRIPLPEDTFQVIGAIVQGIYSTLAPSSPLLQSKALERLANMAPVTGMAFGSLAQRALRTDTYVGMIVD